MLFLMIAVRNSRSESSCGRYKGLDATHVYTRRE